jgi:hypothetical protein
MGWFGGSAPKAPDPKETAAAQTGTNVTTAIANGYLGNINQITPDGSLNYSYGGFKEVKDPTTGAVYQVPTTTVTQTLSPEQQAIKAQQDAAQLNFGKLANGQSDRLLGILSYPFSTKGAPAAGDPSKLQVPTYQQFGSGPKLQTSLGNTGNIQNTIAGAGKIQTSLGDAGDITKSYDVNFDTSKYEDALMQRMNPSLQQNRAALEQKLANQGLQPGSEAYDRALQTATAQENDARFGAILNAGQEQSRLAGLAQNQAAFQNSAQQQAYNQQLGNGQFANSAQAQQYSQNANNAAFGNSAQQQSYTQALNSAQFGNTANQQMYQNQNTATGANNALKDQGFNAQQALIDAQNKARANYINEQYAQRNQNVNEVLGLANGTQVSSPNFVPTQGQQIANVDYAGLVGQKYQNDLAAYQQNQAGIGSLLGGVGSLFALSDKDTKKDIKKVGGLYEYRYKTDPKGSPKRIGVMAQEVEKIRPDAVARGFDGYRRVNYGALFNAGESR